MAWPIWDSLRNVLTGLGTAKDPLTSASYYYCPLDRNTLEVMYRGDWIARAIVDCPAEDATREWRAWQANPDQIEAIEEAEKRFEIQRKLRSALIKARLYGGSALVLGVAQGQPEDELDFDAIGLDDLKFVVVLSMYELSPGPRIYDVTSRWYSRPSYYMVSTPVNGFAGEVVVDPTIQSSSGQVKVHPSRVIEFSGNEVPDWRLSPMGGGWGDSVLQTVDQSLKAFWTSIGGLAGMISDMKLDVLSVPNLSRTLSDKLTQANFMTRLSVANVSKSSYNTLLLDKDELWQRIQTSFGGVSDVVRLLMTNVCASGGVPESVLMGSAPHKGLAAAGGSGGEIDSRNYFDKISSQQKTRTTPMMEPLDRCLVQSALGRYDPHIYYDWNPLYQPDPAQVAAIALQKMQTTQGYWNMPEFMNLDALRRAVITGLKEDGTYPGLEDAIDEFGEAPALPEPDVTPDPPPGMLPKGQFEPNPFEIMKAQKQITGGGAAGATGE